VIRKKNFSAASAPLMLPGETPREVK
jgi:hypothetical protein